MNSNSSDERLRTIMHGDPSFTEHLPSRQLPVAAAVHHGLDRVAAAGRLMHPAI